MALTIILHGELHDFVRRTGPRVPAPVTRTLERRAGLKDVMESLGVPHTEIGTLTVDGAAAGLDTVLEAGSAARIAAGPNPRGHRSPLRPAPPEPPAFVLDTHLGRLARDLRLIGFDSRYANDCDDARLAAIADRESRILLTRDIGLLKRARVTFARFVRADDPDAQIVDIGRHFQLGRRMAPFTRCSHCNSPIETVAKTAIVHRLAPLTRAHYDHFRHCPGCDRLYWRGSHYARLEARLAWLRAAFAQDG